MATEQIVIIGGGPAGIAAAIELKRQGHDPLIYEKNRLGGLLVNANEVINYPGFPDGIDGISLADIFKLQAEQGRIRVINSDVTELEFDGDEFRVATTTGSVSAKYVIVASGTRPKTIDNLAAETDVREKIVYEVYPIRDAEGKRIVIIGAGDAAFDYALTLAERNEVTILNRGSEVKCVPHLWERAGALESVTYMDTTAVIPPCGSSPGGLSLACEGPQGRFVIEANYVLPAIGRTAETGFLTKNIAEHRESLEARGLLYFIGDVKNGNCRQTGIAVGDGIMAAMRISRQLERKMK
ncbi:MAG: NAD(P)/FAD-dependent oxidoreductase [Candidatus Zixiibacteriota bacterium]|nr:MAG: NAD(P)/FAD-dependent oxidoreductase [candidate division Zixibacteria bacterium]